MDAPGNDRIVVVLTTGTVHPRLRAHVHGARCLSLRHSGVYCAVLSYGAVWCSVVQCGAVLGDVLATFAVTYRTRESCTAHASHALCHTMPYHAVRGVSGDVVRRLHLWDMLARER